MKKKTEKALTARGVDPIANTLSMWASVLWHGYGYASHWLSSSSVLTLWPAATEQAARWGHRPSSFVRCSLPLRSSKLLSWARTAIKYLGKIICQNMLPTFPPFQYPPIPPLTPSPARDMTVISLLDILHDNLRILGRQFGKAVALLFKHGCGHYWESDSAFT